MQRLNLLSGAVLETSLAKGLLESVYSVSLSPDTMSERSKPKPADNRRKKPLIFLVDDESLLLDLAEMALQPEGYTLRKFQDPEAALKAFVKARPKPALLISDYAMGKMNGIELIEKCKSIDPELKTILVSGTAGAEIIVNSPVPVDRFVGKPYQPANLSDLVRLVLGL